MNKPKRIATLINNMLKVLDVIGIPMDTIGERTKIRIAEAVLAVADIKKAFSEAKSVADNHFLTTRQIIDFENKYLAEKASPGSYDDIRRHHLILLIKDTVLKSKLFVLKIVHFSYLSFFCQIIWIY